MSDRVFLFLQTHPSFFEKHLVKEMRAKGATCHLINVSLGDWIFRFGTGAKNYVGKLRDWRAYLSRFVKRHGVTDIVYYADQRPYNRIARSLAHDLEIRTYCYEYGYLRPDWITLEKGGMGAFSHLPDDPELIRSLTQDLAVDMPQGNFPHPFFLQAAYEVLYHMAPGAFPFLFAHYRRDRYYHPWIDFPSHIPRLLRTKSLNKHAQVTIDEFAEARIEYFVVPMQIQSDYQVRRASHYTHLSEMVDEVMRSFKRHANSNVHLIFKVHPLDNNMERWPDTISEIAANYDLGKRVTVIDGGNLHKLIENSKGVVTINSTTGIEVIQKNIPLKVLGIAIFDIDGLSHQGPLDDFWQNPAKPDTKLAQAFIDLLIASVQIKGNFFTKEGRYAATREMARRLLDDDVNSNGAYVTPPPRLERAKAAGVPMIYEDLEY